MADVYEYLDLFSSIQNMFTILSEWNDGAVALLIALALIPVVLMFLLIIGIINYIPRTNSFLKQQRQKNRFVYISIHVVLFLISALLVYLLAIDWN